MQVQIKQNPYNAMWSVRPACADSRLRFYEEEHGFRTPTITEWLGREWMQRFMHSEFGTDWLTVTIPDTVRAQKAG